MYHGHTFKLMHQVFSSESKSFSTNLFNGLYLKFKRCDLSFAKKNFLMINYTFFFSLSLYNLDYFPCDFNYSIHLNFNFRCHQLCPEISFFLYEHFGRWWTISQKNKNKKIFEKYLREISQTKKLHTPFPTFYKCISHFTFHTVNCISYIS